MEALFADRSDRGKLRFSGPQDLWFLHQILTQSFEDMKPGEARDTAMLTAHGRMRGYMETVRTDDAVLAHFESTLSGTFPDEIRRYVFATQVEIEDLTSEMGLVLIVDDDWAALAGAVAPDAIVHPTRSLGRAAGYLWVDAAAVVDVLTALSDRGARRADEAELEEIRIRHGAPRWGKEMDFKTIPQEAGIDAWAVHFEKGCYVGQEAMAKIHFRGQVSKRLAVVSGEGLSEGSEVNLDGAKVGTVTSVAGDAALAIVKRSIEPGNEVEIEKRPAIIER